ncbi:MAG: translocation/assembly module TamB, partial [Deltaproteobacteria bacterium]|nr:translocation/assembly module TamB [Deltaproteobacteria bacterium]
HGPDGDLSGNVDITIRHEVPINAEVVCKNVDLQGVLRDAGAAVPFGLQMNGAVSLHGAFDPLDLGLEGKGDAVGSQAGGKPLAAWRASTRVVPHRVSVEARATQSEGNEATVTLSIDNHQFNGEARLDAKDLRPLNVLLPTPVGALAMSGAAQAQVQFAATTEHPEIHAQLKTQDLTVMGSRVPKLEGTLDIARGFLKTSDLHIDSVNGSLSLSGSVALVPEYENAATLNLRNFDTDILISILQAASGSRLPLSGGVVDGSAQLQGKWSRLTAQSTLTANRPRLWTEPLEQISLTAAVTGRHWSGQLEVVHSHGESVKLDAQGDGDTSSQIKVASSVIDIGRLMGSGKRGLAGTVVAEGELSGPLAQLGGHAVLKGTNLAVQEHAIGDFEVQLSGARGDWQWQARALYDLLSARGTFSLLRGQPYTVNGEWRQAELSAFLGGDPAVRLWSSGNLTLAGVLPSAGDASGTIEVSTLDLSRDAYTLRAARPIRLAVDRGRFAIESFELTAGESRISASGAFTSAGSFDIHAQGAGDLVLLDLFGPPVQAARGPFSIEATLKHDAGGAWRLTGTGSLGDGSLDLGLPVAFTRVDLAVRFVGSTIFVDKLNGRAGGGSFEVGGRIDLAEGADLTWTLSNVSFSLTRGFETRVQGSGAVRGPWNHVVVGGSAEVLNALYDREIGLNDLLDWLRQQLLALPHTNRPSASAVSFDLRIYSSGGVFLDNNVAKGEMWVNLYLGGNAAKPALTGTIGILDGEVSVGNRKFTVTGGSIDFPDASKINPTLNISAESRITTTDTDYLVQVTVTGTAEKPRVLFNADDASLSQNDVLSLVAFGKTTAQLQRDSTSVSPASALALIPTGAVSSRVGQLVGVDQFEVTASQARDTGAIEPRVTIGKNLTDQLRALVWTEFGIVARQAVQLEYRVTRRVSLLGSWESETKQSAGAFEGDIKFRFDFRRVPFSLCGAPQTESTSGEVHP